MESPKIDVVVTIDNVRADLIEPRFGISKNKQGRMESIQFVLQRYIYTSLECGISTVVNAMIFRCPIESHDMLSIVVATIKVDINGAKIKDKTV